MAANTKDNKGNLSSRLLILIFVLLAAGILVASLTQMLWLIIALVGALLIGAGAGVGLVWRQQNIRVYKERTEILDALRESEAKYRLLAEHTTDVIWLSNRDLKTIYISPSVQKLRGFSPQEIMEMPLEKQLTPESLKSALELFSEELPRVLAEPDYNPILALELEYTCKNGITVWAESKFSIIRDESGKPVSILGEARDITERKKAEENLEKSRQELRSLSAHLISLREEERTLLAREIHDELGQALTALKMDLSWLSHKLPEGQGPLAEKTASMLKLIDTTIKMVKRLSTELRPGLLDDLGLVAAIEWQAGEFQARTGIKTKLSFEPDDIMVDNEQATALFRIFQEVLTNITRHAAATRIDVYLREKDGVLELSVRDNGKGIEQTMINSPKSLGLIGMRERCHHLGGTVDIRGKPGKGTTVTVNLPAREMRQ